MQITIPLQFDIDTASWADEYGLDAADALADVRSQFESDDNRKAVVAIIRQNWPVLAMHNITVGEATFVADAEAGETDEQPAAGAAETDDESTADPQ